MNRLTETTLEREMRISFAYIDLITEQACKKLDVLKEEYKPCALDNYYKDQMRDISFRIRGVFAQMQSGSDAAYFQHKAALDRISLGDIGQSSSWNQVD